jgi:nucleoside-diphosphate-sugar epimerase
MLGLVTKLHSKKGTLFMQTILGAGGAISGSLIQELAKKGDPIRVASRKASLVSGVMEAVPADVTDLSQTIKAVEGSSVVYLLVGLNYSTTLWQEAWPKIMSNVIEACKKTGARLVFFDNVYMYGKVVGPMTEATPFNPCSAKGEIRARVVTRLLDEIKQGGLTAIIARAADFYGPNVRTSAANILVFDKFAKKSRAMCLVNASTKHSYTFTPDAGKSLAMLAASENAWNQTWHLPTAPSPLTGREFIELTAQEMGVSPKYMVLKKPMLKLTGFFDANIREMYEMLYQNQFDYEFDSTKFAKSFGWNGTSYLEGIRLTAKSSSIYK